MTADTAYPDLPRRYRVRGELGRGGMGRVLSVEDAASGDALRALKLLEPKTEVRAEGERHLREYQVLARLEHPHILRVYQFHRAPATGLQFFTCELLSGPSLERFVTQPLSEARAIDILTQLLRALDYLHSQGWVHADIKPENVLFRGDPRQGHAECCLIDFGLAQPEHDPPNKQIVGTVHSIPPERILGARIDRRSDLYSLGVLAFFLLAGRYPFGGSGKTDILDAHLRRPPPSLVELRPGLSPKLAQIVTAMLAKLPGDRPAGAAAVLRALNEQFGVPGSIESSPSLRAYARNPQCTGWERPLAAALGRVLERTRPAHIDSTWQAVADAVDPARAAAAVSMPLAPAIRAGCRAGMLICRGASAADLTLFREHLERRLEMLGIRHVRHVARSEEPALAALMDEIAGADDQKGGAVAPAAAGAEDLRALAARDPKEAVARVVAALEQLAARGPIVILLERFERADATLFELLQEIGRRESAQGPLGRIAWIGFQFQHPGLVAAQWLSSEEGAKWTESQPLPPLDPESITRWLDVRLPGWTLPSELRDYLEEESEGSPAMLARVLASLIEEGLVRRGWDGWLCTSGELRAHRTPLVRRLHRSFEQLPPAERRVLEAVEILGGSGDAEWTHRISEVPAAEVRAILLRLCERRWLEREVEGVRYQFRYFFQRKAVSRALSAEVLAQGNARVATWLLELKERGSDVDSARLARHLIAAGRFQEALPFARAASRRALDQGHVLAAIRWLERIVRADPRGNATPNSWSILDELADLRGLWGPPTETHALRRAALDAARNQLPGAHAARIPEFERKLAYSEAAAGQDRRAEDRLRMTATIDAASGNSEEARRRFLLLIEIYEMRGAFADARSCLERLPPLAPDADPALAGTEFFLRGELAYASGDSSGAAAIYRRGVEFLERSQGKIAAAWVAYLLGRLAALGGASTAGVGALHHLLLSAYLFEHCHEPRRQARVLIELGEMALQRERLEECDQYLRVAEALLERVGSEFELPRLSATRGTLLALRGLYKEAKPYLQSAGNWIKKHPPTPWGWLFQLRQGALALRTGRRQSAHQSLHGAAHPQNAPHGSGADPWLAWTPIAVEDALAAGEIAQAFSLLELSLRAVRERGGPGAQISLWVLRWKLLTRLGCTEEALRLQSAILQWLGRYPELAPIWQEQNRVPAEAELLRQGNEEHLALYYLEQARESGRSGDLRKYLFELEEAKYHARRASAVPLMSVVGARLQAARPFTDAPEDACDRSVADSWQRLVQSGNRWWRPQVLAEWARLRADGGDAAASARLDQAARREFERLRKSLPFAADLATFAASLGVETLAEACASR
ncbi:MAG: protein kinase [Planctomycetes bacterium]|nr:protein kinase [Planctomycetota bacterium]